MSKPLPAWTPEKQRRHCQELSDALNDIAWDPDWPDLAVSLVPEVPAARQRIGFGWSSLAYQPAD